MCIRPFPFKGGGTWPETIACRGIGKVQPDFSYFGRPDFDRL